MGTCTPLRRDQDARGLPTDSVESKTQSSCPHEFSTGRSRVRVVLQKPTGWSKGGVQFPRKQSRRRRYRSFLIRVVNAERLVRDEQQRAVTILSRAVLHDPT